MERTTANLWLCGVGVALAALLAGCSHGPEPDFHPTKADLASAKPTPDETASSKTAAQASAKAAQGASNLPAANSPPLTRHPTSPDPAGGKFTLAQAVKGLPGKKHGKLVAEIDTSMGKLTCQLFDKKAPVTVANFVGLARGKRPWWDARKAAWMHTPYYDGTTFHRVIPGFMIQGGDYLGNGTGDVGYQFKDEMDPSLKHDKAGQLCMANRGPNTNAAQFFITDAAAPHLDAMHTYTIFGQCAPTSVVAKIARVPQSGPPSNRPNQPVTIEHVKIRRE